ncbi:DNA repair protein RecN [Algivirga pacifica]|uniref:DNA repair protein RecN n=1 Tax=Algivirga pacifica TaxID=1162670 RepID=A0ABP9CX14_9BACT
MLKHLLIKNYALIEQTELSPSKGLNMVTGETGAGKSIMLGALGLLKGGRADSKVLFDESTKCVIEGSFLVKEYQMQEFFEEMELDYEEITILRREITPSGKSRAFINDTPVRLEVMRKVSERLMDIHSQHDTLQLGSNVYQLGLLDTYGQHQEELKRVEERYRAYRKAETAYRTLLEEHEQVKSDFEYHQHLLQELIDADLDGLDQEALEQELEKLENAEQIKASLNEALELLTRSEYSAESGMKTALSSLRTLASYSSVLGGLSERLDSCLIELNDLVFELEKEEGDLFFDEEQIATLKDRLDAIYSLQQKHRVQSLEELLAVRNDLQDKVDKVVGFDDALLEAEQEKKVALEAYMDEAEQLSAKRQEVIPTMSEALNGLLASLGMPEGKVVMQHHHMEPATNGIDEVSILFTANKGRAPQPLKEVASGGEFSRLMLSVKYILATKTALPTIIFDEIDTGISGEIAIKMGQIMREMSQKHQLITISHLPQIAALGDQHYYVYKDNSSEKTISRMRTLDDQERLQEIAQMIGGQNPSEMALNSARELIEAR